MVRVRAVIVLMLVLVGLALVTRALSPSSSDSKLLVPAPAQRAEGIAASVVRRTQTYTLADGLTGYRLTPFYTTTIGNINFVAWTEDRPFDEYGVELPLHFGWHYVHVSALNEISPTGRWDLIDASLSSIVTETVRWQRTLTQTGVMTMTIGDGLVISRPVFASGETVSMVLTHSSGSPLVAGWISVTRFLSESGQIVPGTISATLDMIFEVHNSEQGLTLNYQGITGTLVIASEQSPRFYSLPAYVGDFGLARFQVKAEAEITDTVIMWRPQFAAAADNGRCDGATAWSDGAVSQWVHLDPDRGTYIWLPLHVWAETSGDDSFGFQMRVRNDCVRVAFEGPAGVTFSPTVYLMAFNP